MTCSFATTVSCRRVARRTLLLFIIALPLSGTAGSSSAFGDTDPTITDVVKQLQQWRESFANLRLVWEVRTADGKATGGGSPPDSAPFVQQEWVWADHGVSRIQMTFLTGNRQGMRFLDTWHGPKNIAFQATYAEKPGVGQVLTSLETGGLGAPKPISSIARTPLMGLYSNTAAEWLGELLAEWNSTIDSFELVDGSRCARITADKTDGGILWLDPSHNFLVKQYTLPGERLFTVDKFQVLDNGLSFPKSGTVRILSEPSEIQEWTVTQVTMNEELDDALFTVPVPMNGRDRPDNWERVPWNTAW